MKNKSPYILFNESEIATFSALDDECLGFAIHCACMQYQGKSKEAILGTIADPFQRAYISQLLDGQEIRKQEYLKKCEQNRQAILKRWEKNHPGESCPYVDDVNEEESEVITERPKSPVVELYESNIGPARPVILQQLEVMDKLYGVELIEDAFREAAAANKLNLKYIRAILENWQKDGQNKPSKSNNSINNGPYSHLFKH